MKQMKKALFQKGLSTFIISPLQVKYKEKYEKSKGHYVPVLDTPDILHAKAVRVLASEVRIKR